LQAGGATQSFKARVSAPFAPLMISEQNEFIKMAVASLLADIQGGNDRDELSG
jgi:hypothetical protein